MSLRNWLVRGPFGRLVRESTLYHYAVFGDPARLVIEPGADVNDALFNVTSGTIRVEANAFFGHGVALLTGTHDVEVIGPERKDAVPKGGRDIVIGECAWVSTNATIIGPCRVGRHAVVAAGSVVTEDVPDYAVVAGVPARLVRTLDKL